MKYVSILIPAAAGVEADAFEGRSPLVAADVPRLDALARSGRVGAVRLGAAGGLDDAAALVGLLGYDARRGAAQGPLEAASLEGFARDGDLILAGTLVTLADGAIVDPTGGRPSDDEAEVLLRDLAGALDDASYRIQSLGRYRFVVAIEGADGLRVTTTPPCGAIDQPLARVYPGDRDGGRVGRLLDVAQRVLGEHEINRVRIDLGENPANFVWLWGGGTPATLEPFEEVRGARAAFVGGAPLARGTATAAGLVAVPVDGATGGVETDLAAKANAVIDAMDDHDVIVAHVDAVREAAWLRDPRLVLEALHRVDEHLVAPIHDALARSDDGWRVMVAAPPLEGDGRAPVLIAGSDVPDIRGYPFDEPHALGSEFQIDDGPALMEFFLRGRGGARRD